MRRLVATSLLAALLVPGAASAADAGVVKPPMNPVVPDFGLTTTKIVFPTGLTFLFQADHSHPVVSVMTMVNHGMADDPVGKEETAHFVEHTWFRSVHNDLPPIMDVVQDIGSLFNATTHSDWTDYRTVTSSERLPFLMRLESFRLTEPYKGVTEAQIDIEREVIRNEWRRRNEQSQALILDFAKKATYPEGHPYSRHSSHESLSNIKLADLQAYFDKYYKPENTTIMVVGDFDPDHDALMRLIFNTFDPKLLHKDLTPEHEFKVKKRGITNADQNNPDHWDTYYYDPATAKKGPDGRYRGEPFQPVPVEDWDKVVPRRIPATPMPPEQVPPVGMTTPLYEKRAFSDSERRVKQQVMVSFSLPGGYRDDHWNLMLLGGLANGALAQGLDGVKGLGEKGCFTSPEVLNSTLICIVDVTDKKLHPSPERVAESMLNQFSELWAVPEDAMMVTFLDQVLGNTRNQQLVETLLSLDVIAQHFGGRAEDVNTVAHYTGRVTAHSDRMNQVMKVEASTLRDLAFQYLKRERAAIIVVDPLPEDEIDKDNQSSSYSGASATDTVLRTTDNLATVTDEQIRGQYLKPNLKDIIDTKLPNGLRVIVRNHGEAPVVQADLFVGGGTGEEPYGAFNFVARFTSLDQTQDPMQYAGMVDYTFPYGGAGTNGWSMSGRAPSGNLANVLWHLRHNLDTTKPDLAGFPKWKEDQYKGLKRSWGDRSWHLSRMTREHLFPNHVSGHSTTWEDLDTWSTWDAKFIQDYVDAHLQPANATLVIVGAVEPKAALDLAQQYFGGWKTKPGVEVKSFNQSNTPSMPSAQPRMLIFDNPKVTQTQTDMTCRLDYDGPEDQAAVDVLSSLMFNRVFGTLRVKEGLAYSPGASASASPNGSARLLFSSLAVNQGVGRTVQFFRESVEAVSRGDVPLDEVKLHKLRMARDEGLAAQSSSQLASKLVSTLFWNAPLDSLLSKGDEIATVNADQLRSLVDSCLDHAIVTMDGPAEIIKPQLDKLGYAYEVVEWKAAGDELLKQYDPKAYEKKIKDEAKAEKKKDKDAETSEAAPEEESE